MIGTALSRAGLAWAATATAVACLLCLGAIVALRITRALQTRRAETSRARVRPAVLGVLAAEEDELPGAVAQLLALPRAQWPAAERYVLQTLSEVRGTSRDALVRVLVDRGTLERALRASRGRGPVRRARAAEVLGLLARPEARRRLIHLASDPSRDVRTVAVRALGSLEDPTLTTIVLGALDSAGGVPASVVGTALLRARDADVEALHHGLGSSSTSVRATAAAVAGHLLVTELVGPITELSDDDPSDAVRSVARRALARFGAGPGTDDEQVYG